MSNQTAERRCEWKEGATKCTNAATKHWPSFIQPTWDGPLENNERKFGLQPVHHADLCDQHARDAEAVWDAVMQNIDEECFGCTKQRQQEGEAR